MLTSRWRAAAVRALAAIAFMLGTLLVAPVSAQGAPPEGCEEILNPNGTVIIICEDDDDGGEGGGGGSGGGTQTCHYLGAEVPCSSEYGSWNGRCYVRVAQPQPSQDESVWEGNADGLILECSPFECVGTGMNPCPERRLYWSPNPPNAGPTPRELAERAVAQMNLTMGEIGSTPPTTATKPAAMGVIGLPMWLWVANPGENTIGPITRTAADGGLSVSATGTLDRITWTLTEADTGIARATVTCRGENAAGTPYDGRDNASPSPTCGIPANLNLYAGDFTLTATAYWTVEWQGGGQSDTINVPPQTNRVPVTIGELQVLLSR